MIDVHCHLNFHAFEKDFDEVIKRAKEAGVEAIINVGTSLESSLKAVELAESYEDLYAIVGIHPHHADKLEKGWEDKLEEIAKHKKVVAIGEIGLDYYSYKSNGIVDPKIQKRVFETQIDLAYKLKLPLQIHNRHAGSEVIAVLKKHKNKLLPLPGMFHCFASSNEVLKNLLEMGFYVGFDGNLTYQGLAPFETVLLSELCANTPLEKIVVETDAPFLPPEPHRGGRNEPSYVIITARKIAEIKAVSFEQIQTVTTQNTKDIFNL